MFSAFSSGIYVPGGEMRVMKTILKFRKKWLTVISAGRLLRSFFLK